jgi:hypothetical protein
MTSSVDAPSIDHMLATAADALRAGAADPVLGERLARAETTCAMRVGDRGLTALLDREPIEVVEQVLDHAEVRIEGSEEAWLPVFLNGNLGIALARGELTWSGPVRKYLRVFPIFRTLYGDVVRGRRGAGAAA